MDSIYTRIQGLKKKIFDLWARRDCLLSARTAFDNFKDHPLLSALFDFCHVVDYLTL